MMSAAAINGEEARLPYPAASTPSSVASPLLFTSERGDLTTDVFTSLYT